MSDQYDEDYFLRGKETGRSLYENYRWLPELTIPMAKKIVEHCGIKPGQKILDFGCARGYLVRALRELGFNAYGYDESVWATDNADSSVYHHLTRIKELAFSQGTHYDWIIAKDVLEHIEYVDQTISALMKCCDGIFAVVPLSRFHGNNYVIEDYEKDMTHKQRLPLLSWANFFLRSNWRVECAYRVPGVKDNYFKPGWEYGNGFITARRIKE